MTQSGHGFAHLHAGDLQNRGAEAFNVLHVHGGKHIDVIVEQLHDVFVALVMLAAIDVGVRELVDHDDRWLALQDRVHIHLFEDRALVFQLAARNSFQFRGEFGCGLAAVNFNDAHQHTLAAAGSPNGFTQHRIRFADAGRVAKKKLQYALGFRRLNFLQPLVGRFLHCLVF